MPKPQSKSGSRVYQAPPPERKMGGMVVTKGDEAEALKRAIKVRQGEAQRKVTKQI